jgi:transcriptional regulator of acetoin/glycerol metabolism
MLLYHWPGYVRELRNIVETIVALARHERLDVEDLPPEMLIPPKQAREALPARSDDLREAERQQILAAVENSGGNFAEAAKRLGISRSSLYLRLSRYGYNRPART